MSQADQADDRRRLATPVRAVRRTPEGVQLSSTDGDERFDQVVLACHSDQALRLLADPSEEERAILGSVRYQPNAIVVHTDESFLPTAREAWSAWNYVSGRDHDAARPVSVSYWLNRLQPLPFRRELIETLNPHREPRAGSVLARYRYSHPVFDGPALRAQARLRSIQGQRCTWFGGAWTGYGFHEDGLRSGLAVANRLGVHAPWQAEAAAPAGPSREAA